MTVLSHSPTDMPDWRAASRAAARASGWRPLRFQGPPDFILTSKPHEEQHVPLFRADAREQTTRRARFCPRGRMFRITVKKTLKNGRQPSPLVHLQAAGAGGRSPAVAGTGCDTVP